MNKLNSLTILFFGIFACQSGNNVTPDALFEQVSSSQLGIDFRNDLIETDSFNVLFYEYYYNGSGLGIGDLNNDGLSDIVFGGNMVNCRVYLNQGNLQFADITDKSGINTKGKWVTGVSMLDLNGDNFLDIYLCVAGNLGGDSRNMCFINNGHKDNLSFTEHSATMGIADDGYSTQAGFLDYDLDNDLDLYLLTSSMSIPNKNRIRDRKSDGSVANTDKLYRNEGIDPETALPRFIEVSQDAGITWDGFGLGIAVTDINLDGWPDIYVANDYLSNDLLYINQADGTFKEQANQYFKHTSYSAMGVDIADINNDGFQDIITVDMLPMDYYRKRIMAGNNREYNRVKMEQEAGYHPQYIRNSLQLNNGAAYGQITFSEIGQLAGVHETDWSWAPLFADFDNNGFRDLFVANGIPHDLTNMDFATVWAEMVNENPNAEWSTIWKELMKDLRGRGEVKLANFAFSNSGNIGFDDMSLAWGFQEPTFSTGAAYSDLDNDGDLDLVTNNINDYPNIYRNTLNNTQTINTPNYLQVTLTGSNLNAGGIGSKLWIYYDNQQQFHEHYPFRGFQSSVDPKIHFGLAQTRKIDSLHIKWPDGKSQTLYNILTNQQLNLKYSDANKSSDSLTLEANKSVRLFREVGDKIGIDYRHQEREFVDFTIQPLISHQYSKEGPGIAVGDVNSDGVEDFFIGNGTGQHGMFYIQQLDGTFEARPLEDNPNYEDMGVLLFDADLDGDLDLYVVSGGTGLPPDHRFYQDRLYQNNGSGDFKKVESALPSMRVCGSKVAAADYDQDGDLDLFISGRVDLENYPLATKSFLLRNDSHGQNIRYTDVTTSLILSPDLGQGLISDALWSDFNLDGWVDLLVVGEWMPVTILENRQGQFKNVSSKTGLETYSGWWNCISGVDLDLDGDTDYVVGNLGLNSRLKASEKYPIQIYADDFDKNGALDPIITYYVEEKAYPMHNRDLIIKQIPNLRKRMIFYEDFAKSQLHDIFSQQTLQNAYSADARYLKTAYIQNQGSGKLELKSLPIEAQFAPVYGILTNDYDNDAIPDLILTGNSYSSDIETGHYDAFTGLFLKGNGNGTFTIMSSLRSGFFVDGDAKGIAELTTRSGKRLVLTAQNSGALKAFEIKSSYNRYYKLQPDDFVVDLRYQSGQKERREFYLGGSYLSSSSRILQLPENIRSVMITSFQGAVREISLKD